MADLRLIFRSANAPIQARSDVHAYVHWYQPTGRPHPHHKLREVKKMMCSGLRAGGLINLSSIRGACPLASKIDGSCPSGIEQNNAYQMLSSFYINPFASHMHRLRIISVNDIYVMGR